VCFIINATQEAIRETTGPSSNCWTDWNKSPIALALFSHWSPHSGEHHSSVLVQVNYLEHHPSETWDTCSHQFVHFRFVWAT
jgi:hypothetical protein